MSYNPRRGAYSVPIGRPLLLKELRAKTATIGDALNDLCADDDPLKFDELADEIYSAYRTATNLTPTRPEMACRDHPRGAVDPEPPEGWGNCLLCNMRRRRGGRQVPPLASNGNDEQDFAGYTMPPPPYTFGILKSYLYGVNELVYELDLTSSPDEFTAVADELRHCFVIARELGRDRPVSNCERHPGAPLDPTSGNQCIFCLRPSGVVTTLQRPSRRQRISRPRKNRDGKPPADSGDPGSAPPSDQCSE